jgi:general secretion pathway protein N
MSWRWANWRWLSWTAGILALALFAVFPLRLALDWSDLGRIGITARQVAGTIWYGRIGELHLRSQPLGTLEVALDPAALLIGNVSMSFKRMESSEGPLAGHLVAGWRRGLAKTNGRIDVSQVFAPLPVGALDLQDVTVLFRNGQCDEASGRVVPVISAPIPGVELSGLSGTVECDGERARVRIDSGSGAERVEFYLQGNGSYRARMSVRNPDPMVNASLGASGFKSSPEGMTLSANGRL